MPRPESIGKEPRLDEESEALLYSGANITQLARIFKMDLRDIKAKLNGKIKPAGKRNGFPIYAIKDAAEYLASPIHDIDEFIQKMSIADLPTILRKEFWAGMRSRQLYEKEAAELWPTSDVIDTIAELLKTLRLSLLLSREGVERETELSQRQRDIIIRIIDNALEDAHRAATKRLAEVKAQKLDAGGTDSRTPPGRAVVHAEEKSGSEDL